MSRNTSHCPSASQNGNGMVWNESCFPARCTTTGHSIQSTAVPLRLANSCHKWGLQDASTPPTATTTHPRATSPPPSRHYVRVSCWKATRSIWKGQKCLFGRNAEILQTKCCACCFNHRHGCVCLQCSGPPRAVQRRGRGKEDKESAESI